MDWFAKLLLAVLNWFYGYIPNYGLGIIFLTILVRVAMYPLTLKSMKSMKKMQLLGPEIEELKTKYSDNAQEMNKKMMELYKERGVNPLGGCLPMLLQMPVFIALYRMLWTAYELRGAPFFWWINDLSQPDRLFHLPWMKQVPFLGMFEYFNLLPILMGVAMVVSQKVMPVSGPAQNPQQKLMMNIMPVFFSFVCYRMYSGLSLYILTSTVLGMVQQKFTRVGEVEMKARKPVGKRQHFYTAAQARKRQLAREAKKEKKH
jgi:YidC/Oxa1 family membrane protein insertase